MPRQHDSDDATPDENGPLAAQQGFLSELWDAISPRTVALVVGVLALQLGFILSYVGAFHAPRPHSIPVAIVAPASTSAQLVAKLNAIDGSPIKVDAVASEAIARQKILDTSRSGALIVDPTGKQDRLLIASGGGTSVASAVEQVVQQAEASQQRTVAVEDVVPLQSGDGRGLTGFYLVIGWIVGGYLVAALLGVSKGARPATPRRALIRLLAVVPYAIASGFGGALIVDQVLGALTGHFVALWWLGALIVYASAAVTMALQVLFGVLGIGITVLVFVVLGNPSAGGAYQPSLLPPFWRAMSFLLPNGAGTDTVRRIVYFAGVGIGWHLLVIAAYAIGGTAVALIGSRAHQRRALAGDREAGLLV
ncbi:uncharacterized protein DUF3533 [Jatrophihabitans sp. GAS493]|uniref:DUF3533 domain-containing protein n=1 Tax=Jatrophihabitans sp. GAS493 TaxID=1907575 RepID=UPI000BB7F914|nr:DUF3533 domain-containing protein [Jatrophihabitans sp. GAS493]SOD71021.1 uncharacterized protein DUF3533 [Jatrophihabitans sp. GAS493]